MNLTQAIICIFSFLTTSALSQDLISPYKIIELKDGIDTVRIKEYDKYNNLIFHKIFPIDDGYVIAQILAYKYDKNQLKEYIWFHSRVGFVISRYEEVDSLTTTYEYKQDNETENDLEYVINTHNIEDILSSGKYKRAVIKENQYLREKTFYKDSKEVLSVKFNKVGDTTDVHLFGYSNGFRILRYRIRQPEGFFNVDYYENDSSGNVIYWWRNSTFNSEPSFAYKYQYTNNILTKRLNFERGKLKETRNFSYENTNLSKVTDYNGKGKKIRTIKYYYNKKGQLIKKINSNYQNTGKKQKLTYKYINVNEHSDKE